MEKTTTLKTIPWVSSSTKDLAWTVGLVLAALIAPALLAHAPNNQLLTGTLVNATLFLAAWRLGVANALLVAVVPSSVALFRGLLPAPLASLIPFIIASNVILMASFVALKKFSLPGATVGASLLKFLFLFGLTALFFSSLPAPILSMMQTPQLFTALLGGALALGVIKGLNLKEAQKS
jgi:hypothetical protein